MSKFAGNLKCEICSQPHPATEWPVNGDRVPFYFEREPGRYSVEVWCPKFDRPWYVVWDDDPGTMRPTGFSAQKPVEECPPHAGAAPASVAPSEAPKPLPRQCRPIPGQRSASETPGVPQAATTPKPDGATDAATGVARAQRALVRIAIINVVSIPANFVAHLIAGVAGLVLMIPLIAVLWVLHRGFQRRNRLAWQWGRITSAFSGLIAALALLVLALALLVSLGRSVPDAPPGWLLAYEFITSAALLYQIRLLFTSLGEYRTMVEFGLVCPKCGSRRTRGADLFFRAVRCHECQHRWTSGSTDQGSGAGGAHCGGNAGLEDARLEKAVQAAWWQLTQDAVVLIVAQTCFLGLAPGGDRHAILRSALTVDTIALFTLALPVLWILLFPWTFTDLIRAYAGVPSENRGSASGGRGASLANLSWWAMAAAVLLTVVSTRSLGGVRLELSPLLVLVALVSWRLRGMACYWLRSRQQPNDSPEPTTETDEPTRAVPPAVPRTAPRTSAEPTERAMEIVDELTRYGSLSHPGPLTDELLALNCGSGTIVLEALEAFVRGDHPNAVNRRGETNYRGQEVLISLLVALRCKESVALLRELAAGYAGTMVWEASQVGEAAAQAAGVLESTPEAPVGKPGNEPPAGPLGDAPDEMPEAKPAGGVSQTGKAVHGEPSELHGDVPRARTALAGNGSTCGSLGHRPTTSARRTARDVLAAVAALVGVLVVAGVTWRAIARQSVSSGDAPSSSTAQPLREVHVPLAASDLLLLTDSAVLSESSSAGELFGSSEECILIGAKEPISVDTNESKKTANMLRLSNGTLLQGTGALVTMAHPTDGSRLDMTARHLFRVQEPGDQRLSAIRAIAVETPMGELVRESRELVVCLLAVNDDTRARPHLLFLLRDTKLTDLRSNLLLLRGDAGETRIAVSDITNVVKATSTPDGSLGIPGTGSTVTAGPPLTRLDRGKLAASERATASPPTQAAPSDTKEPKRREESQRAHGGEGSAGTMPSRLAELPHQTGTRDHTGRGDGEDTLASDRVCTLRVSPQSARSFAELADTRLFASLARPPETLSDPSLTGKQIAFLDLRHRNESAFGPFGRALTFLQREGVSTDGAQLVFAVVSLATGRYRLVFVHGALDDRTEAELVSHGLCRVRLLPDTRLPRPRARVDTPLRETVPSDQSPQSSGDRLQAGALRIEKAERLSVLPTGVDPRGVRSLRTGEEYLVVAVEGPKGASVFLEAGALARNSYFLTDGARPTRHQFESVHANYEKEGQAASTIVLCGIVRNSEAVEAVSLGCSASETKKFTVNCPATVQPTTEAGTVRASTKARNASGALHTSGDGEKRDETAVRPPVVEACLQVTDRDPPKSGEHWHLRALDMDFVWIASLDAWVGKHEVTNEQFRWFRPEHRSGTCGDHDLDGKRQPVVNVTQRDAVELAECLTRAESQAGRVPEGYAYRLPSPQEWLVFAQCGDGRAFPWGADWPPPARWNYHGQEGAGSWTKIKGHQDGHPVTCAVDESATNQFGLCGVGGNVWEWTTGTDGRNYILRGGSWACHNYYYVGCRDNRYERPTTRSPQCGFRLVLGSSQPGR